MANHTIKPDMDIVSRVPSKVWEQIFGHVSVHQLLEFRLICRSWRSIVDGCPALMERILLKFPEGFVLDREYKPEYLVPARNLSLEKVRISTVDSWWTTFGKAIVDLKIIDCEFSLSKLLELLKPMESLKSLQLTNLNQSKSSRLVINLDLSHVESLMISKISGDVLNFLVPSFTQLKRIDLPAGLDENKIINLIHSLKDSLEGLTLDYEPTMLKEIIQLKQLTHFTAREGDFSNKDLIEIGKALPKLKSISFCLSMETTSLACLSTMNELECLSLKASTYYCYIQSKFFPCHKVVRDFTVAKNLKLINFKLSGIIPTSDSLYKYFDNSPNIVDIGLFYCTFNSWLDIFEALELFCATLQRLELHSLHVENTHDRLTEYFDSLKCLKIYGCDIPKKLLIKFIRLCPQLEEIQLSAMITLDDEVVLVLCQNLKQLERMSLNDCFFLTDQSVDYILEHCHTLKKLTVQSCPKLSAEAKNKLKSLKNVRCVVE
ncbi:uncharacterized protein LOC119765566 [Culex quinquefasciatus]|uniref:uncharacterized protein LOC119765566 n=1 Tax=Culex quinquefasciatus TaxID=7176 RepID=UPI0018E3ECFD|nr:uncharacterized protein LOC119765566 [Culex quinquefasciatus]